VGLRFLNECWGWVEKKTFFEGWVTKKIGQENVSPQCPPAINNAGPLDPLFFSTNQINLLHNVALLFEVNCTEINQSQSNNISLCVLLVV
jgi:hypothetical protein